MSGRKFKPTLYSLPHGIEVVGEYFTSGRYVMCRIRCHHLFDAKVIFNGMYVRRSRVVMTSMLGRMLKTSEQVHHKNGDPHDDRPENLELIDPAEHNRRHKLGTAHSQEARARISAGMYRAYDTGRRPREFAKGEHRC